jgi:arylsulfatase A-like enzyme
MLMPAPITTTERPNILYIMSDDHAFHAISAYTKRMEGRPVINETPNIDRITDEGMLFENCFCTNSLCTPSRAVLLTGKHSHVTGVTTLGTKLNNRLETFPKLLQKGGYQTAIVGKWHLGHGWRHDPRGFDYWCILPGQGAYHDPRMFEQGKFRQFRGYATDIITDLALQWLDRRDKDKPFCLMVHHKAPHRPWEPDEKHKHMFDGIDVPVPGTFDDDYSERASAASHADMRIESALNSVDLKVRAPPGIKWLSLRPPASFEHYELETEEGERIRFTSAEELKNWKYQRFIKSYLACCASIDDNVGRLLDYLDRESLAGNTIVMYTSDNGFFLGDHRWFDKRFMYEESLRNPFLVRYPPEILAGSTSNSIVTNLDFAETFLDYAGLPVPAGMQGRSLRPLFQARVPDDWDDIMYYRYWENGSNPHKVYAHYGIRTPRYKLIYYYCDPLKQKDAKWDPHEPEWELFDLENDPYELHDVHGKPEYADTFESMKARLASMQQKIGDKPYVERRKRSNSYES